ncbi:hypothetical protein [Dyadobacter sp. NIV53]|uniref:hypothetical protein n=1 Tax=Dyadobacter sp. NIV53 TaxID=2861765 RepID=UPI001C88AF17|nr:hypothetical protein [Dyadobacter sp. NIV53]
MNRKLFANAMLVICTSALILTVIKRAEGIHIPYLIAALSAVAIGFAEPRKGWILAIMQCIFLLTGYFLFTKMPENGGQAEVENFSLYGSAVLTFAGSFLGAFLKRAISGV